MKTKIVQAKEELTLATKDAIMVLIEYHKKVDYKNTLKINESI